MTTDIFLSTNREDAATPEGCARAWRRLFTPEGSASAEPALALYRKAWDATSVECGE